MVVHTILSGTEALLLLDFGVEVLKITKAAGCELITSFSSGSLRRKLRKEQKNKDAIRHDVIASFSYLLSYSSLGYLREVV